VTKESKRRLFLLESRGGNTTLQQTPTTKEFLNSSIG
jgi:hypothetical protein